MRQQKYCGTANQQRTARKEARISQCCIFSFFPWQAASYQLSEVTYPLFGQAALYPYL
jgi:hypothetical protein